MKANSPLDQEANTNIYAKILTLQIYKKNLYFILLNVHQVEGNLHVHKRAGLPDMETQN
jgi:hypothetical protein